MDARVQAEVLQQTAAYLCDEASAIVAKAKALVKKKKKKKKRSRHRKPGPPSA